MFKAKQSAGAEQKNWYKDKYQYVLVQRNILAVTTLVALLLALVAVFTIMQMTPLKTLEPFMINVDDRTGLVQNVESMTYNDITDNEAINNYFVVKYIRSRETYDIADLRTNYNAVRVMSAPQVYREFLGDKRPSNPSSPAAILKSVGKRTIDILSLTYLNSPDTRRVDKETLTAQINVTYTDKLDKAPAPVKYYKQITMNFQYAKLDLTQTERHVNPLGFRVTSYRVDERIIQ